MWEVSCEAQSPPVGSMKAEKKPASLVLRVTLWATLFWPCTTGIARESVGPSHWWSDFDGKVGRGLQQTAQASWRTKFTCIPNPNEWLCSSVQPSQGHTDKGTLQGVELPHSAPQRKSFTSPRAQFVHSQARCWVIAPVPPLNRVSTSPFCPEGQMTVPGSWAAWHL